MSRLFANLDEFWRQQFEIQRPFEYGRLNSNQEMHFSVFGADLSEFSWMKSVIEEAWNKAGSLNLRFIPAAAPRPDALAVLWQPGAYPHVDELGGQVITMDRNLPRWLEQVERTLAHEFGHILGFPDCYVEFWSESEEAFIYYTLDPENRMCSLAGATLPVHYEALAQTYQ